VSPSVAALGAYDLDGYGQMILDRARVDAYAKALRRAVRPGSAVADIGAGTGIWSLLAAKFGARKVYAIEPNDAIDIARKVVADNRLTERIELIKDVSGNVELPERVDVIVSDLRGILPLYDDHLQAVMDARRRFLAPHGVLIPQRDAIWTALIEDPDLYARVAGPPPDRCYGLDVRAAFPRGNSRWIRTRVQPEVLLGVPVAWNTLDYRVVDTTDVRGKMIHAVNRPGTCHGFVAWFDADLVDGIGFSTGPGCRTIYRSAFFPLARPCDVALDDRVTIELDAVHVGNDYVWRWGTRITGHDGMLRADHDQSSFLPPSTSIDQLERRADGHVPKLSDEGEAARLTLSLLEEGNSSLGEVAREIARRFPRRYERWEDALAMVADLADRYGR
jgi:protein arginine N-methyltransferase 1